MEEESMIKVIIDMPSINNLTKCVLDQLTKIKLIFSIKIEFIYYQIQHLNLLI